jgi:hypothetical protein
MFFDPASNIFVIAYLGHSDVVGLGINTVALADSIVDLASDDVHLAD